MQLVIVESPNKCKKISKILGPGYLVRASVGHIRDLPLKELGVDVHNQYRPHYVVSENKKNVVTGLIAAAKTASQVWLATDPDREGEAIAYHLRTVLSLKENYHRVSFSQITEKAIKTAMANPRKLDMQQVAAQETRRILDRLFGYIVSPALRRQSNAGGLSAGRVQSPTVGLVVDREREIEAFVERTHYGAELTLTDNGLKLKLDTKPFQDEHGLVQEQSILTEALAAMAEVVVTRSQAKPRKVGPKAAFTTSDLQQTASNVLRFSPDQTMKLAQKLFEDGRITYHRTDDPNLSDDAWQMIAQHLQANGQAVSQSRRRWKAKDANAQEAHEAIRPASMASKPLSSQSQNSQAQNNQALNNQAKNNKAQNYKTQNSSDIERLYQLIYERAQAAVAADGVDLVSSVAVSDSQNQALVFKASGRVVQEQGWRSLMTLERTQTKDNELPCLPALNSRYQNFTTELLTLKTQPPARYTEATLVKALEKRGIGRPSTYASIFANVFRRGYLLIENGRSIKPTATGCAVVDALKQLAFMDYDYTAKLEAELDRMANGQLRLMNVVHPAYQQLQIDLPKIKLNLAATAQPQANQQQCPKCSRPLKRLAKKKNAKQFFWMHLDEHGDCDQFIDDLKGKPYFEELQAHSCPLCGDALERRYSSQKKKHYWRHKAQMQCAKLYYDDRAGKPVLGISQCPRCKQSIKRLKSKNKGQNGKHSHFWVHISEVDAETCQRFIDDQKGKPVI